MQEKISITLNKGLMQLVDMMRGDVSRSRFIENSLKAGMGLFEAVWIFSNELKKMSIKDFAASHLSQPFGKPLHRHEGFIDMQKDSLDFYDNDMNLLFSVKKSEIRNIKVGYDDKFRRFKHSRGLLPPLHFQMKNRTIYLFVRSSGEIMFKGNNQRFISFLKQ